jgi:hypothetical protein
MAPNYLLALKRKKRDAHNNKCAHQGKKKLLAEDLNLEPSG